MTERKGLSKKLRFEVFKRDSFTCQYCGKSAPSIVLEVDHIKPVSKDGDNDITNLITSCVDCNRGKSDRELSDDAVVLKRKAQLDELQERREQIEMMMEWRNCLDDIKKQELDTLISYINSRLLNVYLNEQGIQGMKASLRKYGLSEMLESASISADQYIIVDGEGTQDLKSIDKFIDYIPRIARSRYVIKEKPYMADLFRLARLMKIQGFSTDYRALRYLEQAHFLGMSIQELEEIILSANSWGSWISSMEGLIYG